MKKIGLMTWYKGENYGSVLQSYSLYSILKKNNDVEFINYISRGNFDFDFEISLNEKIKLLEDKIKKRIHNSLYYSEEKTFLFEEFFRKMGLKESYECISFYDLVQLEKEYEKIVCGSDQIWNPTCFDENYFLNFADSSKIISYAPSIGAENINSEYIKSRMKELLNRFNTISVREKSGKKIIDKLVNKDVRVVLDPTLLKQSNEWSKLCNDKILDKLPSRYMICYFLNNNNKYLKEALSVAKKKGVQLFVIPVFKNKNVIQYRVPFEVGPCEFLSLIKNAECVFTDSYHGMLFSINFNKDFYIFNRFKKNSPFSQNTRIYNILDKFKLNDRLVNGKIKYGEINYEKINKILAKERSLSLKYLFSQIDHKNKLDFEKKSNVGVNKDCCGCSACVNICPTKAISFIKDKDGFEKIEVDKKKCIGCGLCRKVCPLYNYEDYVTVSDNLSTYSFKSKDGEVLKRSSSGGFSFELMKNLCDSYYIAGCVYNYDLNRAEHILIKPGDYDLLKKTAGSKYIKSNTCSVFNEILNLPNESKILFIGTPCQCASLRHLLNVKNKKFDIIFVDLICHGITTSLLWEKYLYEFNNGERLKDVVFRDKSLGSWREKYIRIEDGKNKYGSYELKDNYLNLFLNGKCYMGSCYECPFRNKSCADLRIGDYWGDKYKNDKTGVSMVIPFTKKGLQVFKNVKNGIVSKNDISDFILGQGINNPIKNVDREIILNKLKDKNYSLKDIINDHLIFKLRTDKLRKLKKRILSLKKK